jgi:hypothetical protein
MEDIQDKVEEKQPKTINEKIEAIYEDKAGFGSLAQLISDVKRYYPDIRRPDVIKWYNSNVERNIVQRSGYNSYVAKAPLEEFQIDLFNMKSKTDGDQYSIAMGCIDIFTKQAVVIALNNKQSDTLLDGLKQVFKLMQKPKVLITDAEGGLQSKQVGDYLKKENITYIINRNHAPVIERFIRTFRNMVSRRLQKRDERWHDLIYEVLLTYNRKMVSSATGFSPVDAAKPENIDKVHMNMMSKAKYRNKPYEEIKVGDKVRVFRKRKHLSEKENVPIWSRVAYEVVKIDKNADAGKIYYLSNQPTIPVLRSQILLAK